LMRCDQIAQRDDSLDDGLFLAMWWKDSIKVAVTFLCTKYDCGQRAWGINRYLMNIESLLNC
jgi:hypothetical protein